MNFQRGTVVRTKAGHDKGSFFAVIRIEKDMAYIADGNVRKLSSPKPKKLIHLAFTRTVLDEQTMNDDRKLSDALRRFNEGVGVIRGGNCFV